MTSPLTNADRPRDGEIRQTKSEWSEGGLRVEYTLYLTKPRFLLDRTPQQ